MLSFRVILAQHSRRSTSLAHTLAPLLHFSDRDENLVTETPFSRPLFSSTSALFHFPYPASPAFATHTKTAGCVPTIPILERVHPERSRRVARRNAQVLCFQILPHSFPQRAPRNSFGISTFRTLSIATGGTPCLFKNRRSRVARPLNDKMFGVQPRSRRSRRGEIRSLRSATQRAATIPVNTSMV